MARSGQSPHISLGVENSSWEAVQARDLQAAGLQSNNWSHTWHPVYLPHGASGGITVFLGENSVGGGGGGDLALLVKAPINVFLPLLSEMGKHVFPPKLY